MTEEVLYLTNLYDYYKGLLTKKQRHYFEDYYFDNLSLKEIGENDGISRNAVSSQLLKIKGKLLEYENILKLYKNYISITKIVNEDILEQISDYI